jgi:hypothetical protein
MIISVNNIGALNECRSALYHKAPNTIFFCFLLVSYGPEVFIMIRQSQFFEISLVASRKKFNIYRYFNTIYEKCCSSSVSSHVYILFVVLLCFCIDQFQFLMNERLREKKNVKGLSRKVVSVYNYFHFSNNLLV